ncbi:MAG: beta-glucosidase BglX, partial [Bacteroidales bacterium]|nr:beta-glucosidase BglX [Bacteroidales bacterium]
VDSLLNEMTIEEKIGQMVQITGFFDPTGPVPVQKGKKQKYDDIAAGRIGSMLNVYGHEQVRTLQKLAVENSRLGIPMIFGYDVIHGFKNISPIPLAEAASWDLKIIEESARLAGDEAAAYGINWTFAPMVDISRDARWGRVMEGAGEDTYLGCEVAKARVRGFQGDDLSANNTIAACAKHFAAYGFAEAGKDYNTADIGTTTLYNYVLPPFKASVDAGAQTFMNSFNDLNGIPATANHLLVREILKGKWGFEGFLVSDWGSAVEMIEHGFASDVKHAAELAINAGCDMDMENEAYLPYLKVLVEEGKVDVAKIDDAVRRILTVKFKLGLFDDPYKYCSEERYKTFIDSDEVNEQLIDIAKKSIVLLKNEGNLLPLDKNTKQKIALIGPLADDKTSPLGSWRLAADNNTAVSVLEGLNDYPVSNLKHEQGVVLTNDEPKFTRELAINTTDSSDFDKAAKLAKESDVVIMVLGEHGFQSGEGRSRANISLPGLQQQLLERVYHENKNIILVLMNGRPLAIPWAAEHIPAILETWHLGSMSGHAIAQVLMGDYNPSGKLPVTFPRSVGQVPIYYNHKNTGRPGPKNLVFWTHYIDESNDPQYPFGFGLSYTTFEYSDLKVQKTGTSTIKVSVNVKNTGKLAGEEVVQVYIRDMVARIARPVKELKAFEKIKLQSGESQALTFELTKDELGYFSPEGEWLFDPGEFEIFVGGNSRDNLKEKITL